MRRKILIIIPIAIITAFLFSSCDSTKTYWEYMKSDGTTIWYECANENPELEEIRKDTIVYFVRVFSDGKQQAYQTLEDIPIGYFSNMTDEEILKDLKDNSKYATLGNKENPTLYIFTNNTGESTEFESIPFTNINRDGEKHTLMYLSKMDEPVSATIYKSNYIGYNTYLCEDYSFGGFQLTRVDSKDMTLNTDSIETKDAKVDAGTPREVHDNLYGE